MDEATRERTLKGVPHTYSTHDVRSNDDIYDCYSGIVSSESYNNNASNNNGHYQPNNDVKCRLERARSRYVTVEVPLVLVSLVMSMVLTCRPEYLRERIARDVYHYNGSTIHNGSTCDVNVTETEEEIQSMTSTWLLYLGMIQSLPGLFMAIVLGSLSDRMGRKPALVLCTLGYIATVINSILVVYFHLPIFAFVPGDLMSGLCGGLSLLLSTGASYVSDVTSPNMRTFRIVVVEASVFIGYGIGQIALGFSLQYSTNQSLDKYVLPLWVALGCGVASLLYTTIPEVLLETVNKKNMREAAKISAVFRGIYELIKDNTNGRRVKLLGYIAVMFFAVYVVQGFASMFVVYSMGAPFCLSSIEIGIVSAITVTTATLGLIGGGAILPKCLSDNWIVQASLSNALLTCIVTGLATTKVALCIGTSIGLLRGLSFPVIRSQLSKVSAEHERGLMLALIGITDGAASFLVPVTANSIYAATVFFYPPFVFFFLGGMLTVPFIVTGALQCYERRQITYTPVNIQQEEH